MRLAKLKEVLEREGVDPADFDRLTRAAASGNSGEYKSLKQEMERKYGQASQAGCLIIILAVPVLVATGSVILKGL